MQVKLQTNSEPLKLSSVYMSKPRYTWWFWVELCEEALLVYQDSDQGLVPIIAAIRSRKLRIVHTIYGWEWVHLLSLLCEPCSHLIIKFFRWHIWVVLKQHQVLISCPADKLLSDCVLDSCHVLPVLNILSLEGFMDLVHNFISCFYHTMWSSRLSTWSSATLWG